MMSANSRQEPNPFRLSLRELVAIALSRYAMASRARETTNTGTLNHMLWRYGRTPLVVNGQEEDPPHPKLPGPPFPSARDRKIKRLFGLSLPEIRANWAVAADARGSLAVLDRALLDYLFPPGLQEVAVSVITDGPGVVADRLQRIVFAMSREELGPTRARPRGGLRSSNNLHNHAEQFRRFLTVIRDLHKRQLDAPGLDAWTGLPERPTIRRRAVATDRSAPSLRTLRRTWQHLDKEVRRVLGDVPLEESADAMRRMPAAKFQKNLRRFRDWALLGILVATGCRVGALMPLQRGDFVRDHISPDGRIGPALAFRPGKTWEDAEEISWKPIPVDLAHVLEAYLVYVARYLASHDPRFEPLRGDLPLDWPLFFGSRVRPDQPMDRSAIARRLSGHPRDSHGPQPALLPKDPDAIGLPASSRTPEQFLGFGIHRVRAATIQIINQKGKQYLEAHGIEGDPEKIAEALTDHAIPGDPGNYRGYGSPEARERWSGVATQITWEALTGELGARKAPDASAFRSALLTHAAVEAELTRLGQRLTAFEKELSSGNPTNDDLVQLVAMQREERTLQRELGRIEVEIERIKFDPTRHLLLPDDAPDSRIDLGAIEREMRTTGELADPTLVAVRDWITVSEFAFLYGHSEATARKWVSDGTPYPAGDRRSPWDPSNPPIDSSLGPRRRRIWVGGLSDRFLSAPGRQKALNELLSRWPKGWSEDLRSKPLRVAGWSKRRHLEAQSAATRQKEPRYMPSSAP
jgi:hypothetical protein